MTNKNFKLLGPLQLRVMNMLWDYPGAPFSVNHMHEKLNEYAEHPRLAQTTVGAVMRSLNRIEFTKISLIGGDRAFYHKADISREDYLNNLLRHALQDVCGGYSGLFDASVELTRKEHTHD